MTVNCIDYAFSTDRGHKGTLAQLQKTLGTTPRIPSSIPRKCAGSTHQGSGAGILRTKQLDFLLTWSTN